MTAIAMSFPMEISREAIIDWAEALESNRRWLMTVIRSRLSDHQAAEDVLQEVALAAFAQPSKPTDPEKVAPWLYRIALRKVINHYRASGRRRRLVDRAIAGGYVANESQNETPGEWLLRNERNENVSKVMEKLDSHDRQILLLKYSEGWGYQELSEHLGVSIKTVEYRLLKARKALRAKLNDPD